MNRLHEELRLDVGLVPQALNNNNVTGRYFSTKNCARILAHLKVGAMAATKTAKVELLQATDKDGTGSKGIPSTVGQLATAEITANALVTKATITLATFLAGGTITINGLVFTAHATTTTPANREFSIATSDTAAAAALVTCVNDPTYGVPGVKASSNAGVVTLEADPAGEVTITVSSSPDDGTCTKATAEAQAYVEVRSDMLDYVNGFTFVAPKVTTTANTVVSVAMLRGAPRFAVAQKVGASAAV